MFLQLVAQNHLQILNLFSDFSADGMIFAVVDCTGHGVPGAFMSMIGISLLNEIVVEKGIENVNTILVWVVI